ncbi:Diphthine--ammonia ligase [Colletotrichum orbiculare MAFF 240422]|uniref:Diphthine--ammonia ligase n=1 Tax=Colletotrichum orbiculare (strain 104-T / ATCC 96160 / CBS 514.97 / LARS 414 / MAFF 240422) TaxID=1213857 RepID=A0A484G9H5_COLOR|nr:Diphthine--ammonia ligase [Colletotrichum orbiculare MAFF 240422]
MRVFHGTPPYGAGLRISPPELDTGGSHSLRLHKPPPASSRLEDPERSSESFQGPLRHSSQVRVSCALFAHSQVSEHFTLLLHRKPGTGTSRDTKRPSEATENRHSLVAAMASAPLNVIALVSGGKDSFFSALHCQRNGHRLVALANLFPAESESESDGPDTGGTGTVVIKPGDRKDAAVQQKKKQQQQQQAETVAGKEAAGDETDLNSFMYQTVGHQVIPLYADATGLPLYRQPIRGGARYEGRDYDSSSVRDDGGGGGDAADETESMVPLLRAIMADHPGANALCAGAILSTYQRTRVESVALRLGLAPLAYLWKYPVLPPPAAAPEEAQLLHDMAAAGLDARIVKVASAGLDDEFLWTRVSSLAGAGRVKRALRKFGVAEGAPVLGEGGEFETIVLDGPPGLFPRGKIEVPEAGRRVVREGGGTSWLSFEGARVREKETPETETGAGEACSPPRVPDVLDARFRLLLDSLPRGAVSAEAPARDAFVGGDGKVVGSVATSSDVLWTVEAETPEGRQVSVEEETEDVVRQIRERLAKYSPPLPTTAITHTVIVLKRMSDFPAINAIYGSLFQHPNPPSRVTIACGNLPGARSINIHLTVRPDLEQGQRNGLHVQSRSYWAPANIGPYSQAIDVPLSSSSSSSSAVAGQVLVPAGVRAVTIAGQIPLVPASMMLPPAEPSGDLKMQIVLSLQHLWRIATELKVQVWTSAVAYFANTPDPDAARRRAQLAAAAWEGVHNAAGSEEDDDDDESGPDLWDRKFNTQHMVFGASIAEETKLPDWSVVKTPETEGPKPVPPFFAVEVEELPRAAGVEWHAHLGLANLASSSAAVEYQTSHLGASERVPFSRRVCHVTVGGVLVHTTVAWLAAGADGTVPESSAEVAEGMRRAYAEVVGAGGRGGVPYLMYVNQARTGSSGAPGAKVAGCIPARSIRDADGLEVVAVGLFK